MSDLIEFIVEIFLEGVVELARSKKTPVYLRIAIYFLFFSVVVGFLILSFMMRHEPILFFTFSIIGSGLGIWFLFMLKDFAKDYKKV